jgi:hypothetical protein
MGKEEAGMERRREQLVLAIQARPDVDLEELEHLTAQLRRGLLELDVESVELARGEPAPPGARAVDPTTIGTLIVTLAPTTIQALVQLVRGWSTGRRVGSVKITLGDDSLELTNASQADLDRLTTAFLERLARP